MSFDNAKNCLSENLAMLTGPGDQIPPENMALWNLNRGLLSFFQAVELRLNMMDAQLKNIERRLPR